MLQLYLVVVLTAGTIDYTMSVPVVTCNVSAVSTGNSAILKCFFHVDMRNETSTIFAYQHRTEDDSTIAKKVKLLECRRQGHDYDCRPRPGFKITGSVSDTLTLEIEHATEDDQGNYSCERSPSEPHESTKCTLTFAKPPSTGDPTSPVPTNRTSDNNGSGTQNDESNAVLIGVLVAVGVLAVMIIVVVVVFRNRRMSVDRYTSKELTPGRCKTDYNKTETNP